MALINEDWPEMSEDFELKAHPTAKLAITVK
jgi:hypothetical protein